MKLSAVIHRTLGSAHLWIGNLETSGVGQNAEWGVGARAEPISCNVEGDWLSHWYRGIYRPSDMSIYGRDSSKSDERKKFFDINGY